MNDWLEVAKEFKTEGMTFGDVDQVQRMAEEIVRLRKECVGMGRTLAAGVVVPTGEYTSIAAERAYSEKLKTALEWYANPCSQCEASWVNTCHGSPVTAREALKLSRPGAKE